MTKFFRKLRGWFTDIKIFIARAQSYLSMANAGMILFIFLSTVKEKTSLIPFELEYMIIPLFIASLLGMIFIGWLENKFKIHQEEQDRVTKRNPFMNEVLARLKRIEENVKEMKDGR